MGALPAGGVPLVGRGGLPLETVTTPHIPRCRRRHGVPAGASAAARAACGAGTVTNGRLGGLFAGCGASCGIALSPQKPCQAWADRVFSLRVRTSGSHRTFLFFGRVFVCIINHNLPIGW